MLVTDLRSVEALSGWKRDNNLNSQENIHKIEKALEEEQSALSPRFYQIFYLKKELAKAYWEEEVFWSQKSRETWMHCGDRNTLFFHNSVKNNRGKNRIDKLLDINGSEHFSDGAKG